LAAVLTSLTDLRSGCNSNVLTKCVPVPELGRCSDFGHIVYGLHTTKQGGGLEAILRNNQQDGDWDGEGRDSGGGVWQSSA